MKNKYISTLALTDLLFNLILGFVFLFLISFLLINKPEKTADVEKKAEMIVIMHWEDMHEADIDLWVQTPHGTVNFVQPTRGNVFLDKDDLGTRNDWYWKPNGELEVVRINREVVTFRALEVGDYTINAHYYSSAPAVFPKQLVEEGWLKENPSMRGPANVTVEVIRLNPFYIVHTSSHILEEKGAQKTFINFELDDLGVVRNINYLPKNLIRGKVPGQEYHLSDVPDEVDEGLQRALRQQTAPGPSPTTPSPSPPSSN
jgi:hypothetical protein